MSPGDAPSPGPVRERCPFVRWLPNDSLTFRTENEVAAIRCMRPAGHDGHHGVAEPGDGWEFGFNGQSPEPTRG